MGIKQIKISSIAIIVVMLTAISIDLSLKNWTKQEKVIEWDVHNYYAYLPLVFIYDDIHIEKDNYNTGENLYWFWPIETKEGKNVIKGPIGMTYVYAPFFFVAHGFALLTDYPSDGFSEPYKVFLLISALFFLFVGLDFTRKNLEYLGFSNKVTAYTILVLGMATNLLAYSSSFAPMPHVYNFALIAIFIYYTFKWHENQKLKNIVVLGLVLGVITVIRPTNVLIAIFFLFYKVHDIPSAKEKWQLIKKQFFKLTLFLPLGLLIWIPQFWYWKVVTGDYTYYSFGEERFFFMDPKILEGLFSFRKGWLVYTPAMAFSIVGIYFLKEQLVKLRSAIISFALLNIYIIFSWWCWWYGGSYGQRSMIDSYSLLALPLAAFIKVVDNKRVVNYLFYAIFLFFSWLTIFQMYQFERQSLHYDSMSQKAYFIQFGKLHPTNEYYNALELADYDEAKYRGRSPIVKEGVNDELEKNRKEVNIMAFNNKYLCTEWDRVVIADKEAPNTWEKFTLVFYDDKECSLLSYDGKYLSIEQEQNIKAIGEEKTVFEFINFEDGFFAFRTTEGLYLSIDDSFQLKVSTTLSDKAKFKLKEIE